MTKEKKVARVWRVPDTGEHQSAAETFEQMAKDAARSGNYEDAREWRELARIEQKARDA